MAQIDETIPIKATKLFPLVKLLKSKLAILNIIKPKATKIKM